MNRCSEARRIQDYLDGETSGADALAFRRHLDSCPACAAELALLDRAFRALDRLPLVDPTPALAERVLSHVLPSRIRRRWMRAAAWGYAASFAICLAAGVVLLSRPGGRLVVEALWTDASRRLVEAALFGANAVTYALLALVDGWGLIETIGTRLMPFVRAIGTLVTHPVIEVSLVMAVISCAALLWWMRPREKGSNGEPRHVGVLGF
jgi:predicted anti-sigma-YlaC factor YlaD